VEFFEVVRQRQSVRAYSAREVDPAAVQSILEATNRAPSAGNFQAFEVYVVRGREKQAVLAAATFDQKFVAQAQLSLVFCTNASRCQYDGADTWALEDATIATTFAMLAIADLGLATCWVGAFLPEKVAAVIGAPAGVVPMAILPIGHAGEVPERTTRRSLAELVHEG
jgi:nitroreductase